MEMPTARPIYIFSGLHGNHLVFEERSISASRIAMRETD